jgi:hypothetical protein
MIVLKKIKNEKFVSAEIIIIILAKRCQLKLKYALLLVKIRIKINTMQKQLME